MTLSNKSLNRSMDINMILYQAYLTTVRRILNFLGGLATVPTSIMNSIAKSSVQNLTVVAILCALRDPLILSKIN